MKHNLNYKDFGKFIIRCPSFPFVSDDIFSFEKIIKDDFFMEAIYLSSPELYHEILKVGKSKDINEKHKYTLIKYWNRIRTRSTPFGIFSGIGVGNISNDDTNFIMDNEVIKIPRMDMGYLTSLIFKLQQDYDLTCKIKYFANNSIYRIANNLRYYATKKEEDKNSFTYELVNIEYTNYLGKIISKAKNGILLSDLRSEFDSKYTNDDIDNFLHSLIEAQILISELSPMITGGDLLQKIISIIENSDSPSIKENLNKIHSLLNNNVLNIKTYKDIEIIAKEIYPNFKSKELIQVDLKRTYAKSNIHNKIIDEIKEAILFLNSIENPHIENQNLRSFINTFYQIYEEEELPLLYVLDSDVGIGYPVEKYGENYTNSLIDNFELPDFLPKNKNYSIIKNLITHKLKLGKEINLEKEKIDIKSQKNNFYPVFYTCFEFVNIEEFYFPRIKYVGDNSGIKLMTRFSHTDEQIRKLILEIDLKEQELSKEILVEIVHLPNPRLGNISTKPFIRDYEITCLTFSDRDKEKQIPLSDLMISIKNDRVILRSKKLNKIVKPILTSAHNFEMSDFPIYKFLCDIQFQEKRNVYFPLEWGLKYTPRIRYKRVHGCFFQTD